MDRTTFFLILAGMFAVGVALNLRNRYQFRRAVRTGARIVGVNRSMGIGGVRRKEHLRSTFYVIEFEDREGCTHRVHLSEAMAASQGGPSISAEGLLPIRAILSRLAWTRSWRATSSASSG